MNNERKDLIAAIVAASNEHHDHAKLIAERMFKAYDNRVDAYMGGLLFGYGIGKRDRSFAEEYNRLLDLEVNPKSIGEMVEEDILDRLDKLSNGH